MTDSTIRRTMNDIQVMSFRLGITAEELIRIAEATSWEAVERAVARRSLRRGDIVQHIATGKVYRVKMAGRDAANVQVEIVDGFETRWGLQQDFRLVGGAE